MTYYFWLGKDAEDFHWLEWIAKTRKEVERSQAWL